MHQAIWWILVPAYVAYAVAAYLVYAALGWWPFTRRLPVSELCYVKMSTEWQVQLQTIVSLGLTFGIMCLIAYRALDRNFDPSDTLYDHAEREFEKKAAKKANTSTRAK